jgi:molecular chaperone GrpE
MKNKEKENNQTENSVNPESAENQAEVNESNLNQQAEQDEKDILIQQLQTELGDYKDRLLRKAAEFENYKRRNENDQLNLLKYAAEGFITKLLPVVDDFERSLQHMNNNSVNDITAVKEGVQLIYDKLMKLLNDQGVSKIEAVGKPFDVNFHEAIMQRKVDGVEPHTVLDEIETGYMYKDRVIRHSKVIVSEETADEISAADDSVNNSNNEGQQ